MLRLFRQKIFFVVKYFQRNHFFPEKYFSTFGSYEKNHHRRKTTSNEIPSLVGIIPATFSEFQQLLSNSDNGGRNPMAMTRSLPISPKSSPVRPDSSFTG